jgi:hypothetical protein
MTPTTAITRTIRVAIGTAAALALTSQAAQARPSGPPVTTGRTHVTASSSILKNKLKLPATVIMSSGVISASPDAKVARALAHAGQVVPTPRAQSVDWSAAAIGTGLALALVVVSIGAAALIINNGRRRVPLSA